MTDFRPTGSAVGPAAARSNHLHGVRGFSSRQTGGRRCARGQARFVNHTGRNDLVAVKASWDATNAHFSARCRKPIGARTNANWMLLFLDTDHDVRTG